MRIIQTRTWEVPDIEDDPLIGLDEVIQWIRREEHCAVLVRTTYTIDDSDIDG